MRAGKAIALAAVAALIAVGGGLVWRSIRSAKPPPLRPSPPKTDAGAQGRDAGNAGKGDKLAAVFRWVDGLRSCIYPHDDPLPADWGTPPVKHWAVTGPLFGLRLGVTAGEDVVSAELWGDADGKARACFDQKRAALATVASGGVARTIDVPLDKLVYAPRPGKPWAFLTAGGFGIDRAASKAIGDGWRVLCPGNYRVDLLRTRVRVKSEEIMDEPGWITQAAACPRGESMVRGPFPADWPPAGAPLPTGFMRAMTDARDDDGPLSFAARGFRMRHISCDQDDGYFGRFRLLLETDTRTHVLGGCEIGPELWWAGDIDGDGKLDVITTQGVEGPREDLHLSTGAGDQMMRRVAAYQGYAD